MNNPNENNSSPIEEKSKRVYIVTIGCDHFRVINIYVGTKSASKAIYDAAVKKILYNAEDNL